LSATSESKSPVCQGSPIFEGCSRRSDKIRLVQEIRKHPDGINFRRLVGKVFDLKGPLPSDTSDPDYQLAYDTVRNADFLEIDKRNGDMLRVTATPEFLLEPQYALAKTSGRDGDDEKLSFSSDETGNSDDWEGPKDRVRNHFQEYTRVDKGKGDVQAWLLTQLAAYKKSISDKYNVFRHRDTGDYGTVPYRTRHNDLSRATSVLDGFQEAVSRASDRFRKGTLVTLTADPKRFDSRADARQATADGKARFMSWLSSDNQLGHRPDNLTVPEYQDNGMLHFHICLFGVTPSDLPSKDDVRSYWNDRQDIGHQVHMKPVRNRRNGRWLLRDTEGGDNTDVSLRGYLTDAMYGLIRVADTGPSELLERARSGDTSLWKQALYWYTERQYWSGSDTLKGQDSADTAFVPTIVDRAAGDVDLSLPDISLWEHVGTFHRSEIPARVFRSRDAAADDRPPPKEN
jgi:hypothetical protein